MEWICEKDVCEIFEFCKLKIKFCLYEELNLFNYSNSIVQ